MFVLTGMDRTNQKLVRSFAGNVFTVNSQARIVKINKI